MNKYVIFKVNDNLEVNMLFKIDRKYVWKTSNEDYRKLVAFNTLYECEEFVRTHKDKISGLTTEYIKRVMIF